MSAADRMVIRTRDGAYKSVPRRTGLGMISRGHAQVAPDTSPEPHEPHNDEYQASGNLAELLDAASTPASTPDRYKHPLADVDPVDLLPNIEAQRGPVTYPTPGDEPEQSVELPAEPRGNASRQEWATYAYSLGVEVATAMSRNEIRDAAQDAAQSLARLPQPALPGGRLDTPEDEPVTEESVTDDEDPGTR